LIQASILKIIFPIEYQTADTRESKTFDLPQEWIRSLMRQESSFRPDAKSSSNALGVMQLIPPTGNEVAKDLKVKNFTIPESLLDPDINIKLGTAYLARMIRAFGGNVPLGLAAYNAGPQRLKRWLEARKDLNDILSQRTSAPDAEIWMDELPWDETSFYVKAILRNWLIYRLLDGSKVKLADPIWVDEKTTTG
jgi:soluble lytic murein transglycosylase